MAGNQWLVGGGFLGGMGRLRELGGRAARATMGWVRRVRQVGRVGTKKAAFSKAA